MDIEEEIEVSLAERNGEETVKLLILEVLLDIREILRERLPADF